jgi:hypothetical protein
MSNQSTNIGLLYICAGDHQLSDAIQSVKSAKKAMPNVETALITDAQSPPACFDTSITKNRLEYSFIDKVRYITETPFENTLYLDADTRIYDDISELTSILDKYELAAAHAPGRRTEPAIDQDEIPAVFPEYNTGVILFRRTDKILDLFESWLNQYDSMIQDEHQNIGDQPAFRKAAWFSNIHIYTLPPEYNCRTVYPGVVGGDVKIVHGRHRNVNRIEQKLNAPTEIRAHYTSWGRFKVVEHPTSAPQLIVRSIVRDGFRPTVRKIYKKIKYDDPYYEDDSSSPNRD